jgi:hypothetical protein
MGNRKIIIVVVVIAVAVVGYLLFGGGGEPEGSSVGVTGEEQATADLEEDPDVSDEELEAQQAPAAAAAGTGSAGARVRPSIVVGDRGMRTTAVRSGTRSGAGVTVSGGTEAGPGMGEMGELSADEAREMFADDPSAPTLDELKEMRDSTMARLPPGVVQSMTPEAQAYYGERMQVYRARQAQEAEERRQRRTRFRTGR